MVLGHGARDAGRSGDRQRRRRGRDGRGRGATSGASTWAAWTCTWSMAIWDFCRGERVAAAGGAGGRSWYWNQIVRLDPRVISDQAMLTFVSPHIEENRRRAERKLPVGLTAQAGTGGELAQGADEKWTYASTAACALCHGNQKQHFDTSVHAFAMQTLQRKGRERDPYCLGCHATAFDRPGRHPQPADRGHLLRQRRLRVLPRPQRRPHPDADQGHHHPEGAREGLPRVPPPRPLARAVRLRPRRSPRSSAPVTGAERRGRRRRP